MQCAHITVCVACCLASRVACCVQCAWGVSVKISKKYNENNLFCWRDKTLHTVYTVKGKHWITQTAESGAGTGTACITPYSVVPRASVTQPVNTMKTLGVWHPHATPAQCSPCTQSSKRKTWANPVPRSHWYGSVPVDPNMDNPKRINQSPVEITWWSFLCYSAYTLSRICLNWSLLTWKPIVCFGLTRTHLEPLTRIRAWSEESEDLFTSETNWHSPRIEQINCIEMYTWQVVHSIWAEFQFVSGVVPPWASGTNLRSAPWAVLASGISLPSLSSSFLCLLIALDLFHWVAVLKAFLRIWQHFPSPSNN